MASSHPVVDQDQQLAVGREEAEDVKTGVPIVTAPSVIAGSDGSFAIAQGNRLTVISSRSND
jgi:hypothetical protein